MTKCKTKRRECKFLVIWMWAKYKALEPVEWEKNQERVYLSVIPREKEREREDEEERRGKKKT